MPRTLDELRAGLAAGVQESAALDAKRELSKKSTDIGVDVTAMTVEGGTIIYGVDELEDGRLVEHPISLAGQRERVSSIVASIVSERPIVEVFELPVDEARGFLVVAVPPSPRAPHMVQVRGEWRYYGRGPGGNIPLTEGEVARLYDRRRQFEAGRESLLDDARVRAPLPPPGDDESDLHVVVRPVIPDVGLRQRVWPMSELNQALRQAVAASQSAVVFAELGPETFSNVVSGNLQNRLDGVALLSNLDVATRPGGRKYVAELEVSDDGSVRFFFGGAAFGRASSMSNDQEIFTANDWAIGRVPAYVAHLSGALYAKAGYSGPVDFGLAIVGARSARSSLFHDMSFDLQLSHRAPPSLPDPYHRLVRLPANELLRHPIDAAQHIVEPFLRVLRQGMGRNILAEPPT